MKKVVRIIFTIIIITGVLYTFFLLWKKSQPKEVVYEIVEAKQNSINRTSMVTGKIIPSNEVVYKPYLLGVVDEIYKSPGDKVSIGDNIARLRMTPNILNINSANARVDTAKINLGRIEAEYKRQKYLSERGIISIAEMQRTEASYKKAKVEVDASIHNLDIAKHGYSDNTNNYDYTWIKSTVNGTILEIPIEKGSVAVPVNKYNRGTTIATIADMENVVFTTMIDETEIARIHIGLPISLLIRANQNAQISSVLDYISPKGVQKKGAVFFEVKASLKIPQSLIIHSGNRVDAEISIAAKDNIITIPERAVSFENDSSFVYVLKEKWGRQQFTRRHITLGLSDKTNIEVKSGLNLGEKIRGVKIILD